MEKIINKEIAKVIEREKEIGLLKKFEIVLNTDKKLVLKDSLGITIYQHYIHSEKVDAIRLYDREIDFILDGLRG